MANDITKLIVKVGKTSKLKFSGCKVFRILTASELSVIANKHPDCDILIIEGILEDEQDSIRDSIKEFMSNGEKHHTLFYIPDDDEITAGIADEFDCNIYMTLQDLYTAVYDISGTCVSVFIDDKAKYNSVSDANDISDSTDALDSSEFESSDPTSEETENTDNVNDTTSEVESVDSSNESETEPEEGETPDTDNTDSEVDSGLLEKYKQALNDAREATKHYGELEDIINTIKEEKEDILNRFNAILSSAEVLEEPIPLSQYEELKAAVSSKDTTIKSLNESIEKLKSTLSDCEEKLESVKADGIKKDSTIETLENHIKELQAKIESGELLQGTINEYTAKLAEAEAYSKDLVAGNEALTSQLSEEAEHRNVIFGLNTQFIQKLVEATDSISKLEKDIVQANESIAEYRTKYEEAQGQISELNLDLQDNANTIMRLQNDVETAKNEAIAVKNQFSEKERVMSSNANQAVAERDKLVKQLQGLSANLKLTKEQLDSKDRQYKDLLESTRDSSSTTAALTAANNALDTTNRSLNEKIAVFQKEIASARAYKAETQKQLEDYKVQTKRLTDTLNSLSRAGNLTTLAKGEIPSIRYTESAQIFTIMGSGNFGVTTTAMSLCKMLSANARVLYIDFDLNSPCADGWFGKSPFCKQIPAVGNNPFKTTGLAVFYEMGASSFQQYVNSLIIKVDNTKGGGLDYLSGIYYKLADNSIAEADYSTLFNTLGRMYQYIVIDMGAMTNNGFTPGIAKAFNEISTRGLIVTSSDLFDIRNFRQRIKDNNLSLERLAWLINMCETDNDVTSKHKAIIDPVPYGMILRDYTVYGKREVFTHTKQNKDRFEFIVKSVLFKRK